jgi:hypothetical protein
MTIPVPARGHSAQNNHARDLVDLVLVEAVGSSITPFVPLPFVDDYLFARLLRRITRKVIERARQPVDEPVVRAVVDAYLGAGESGFREKAITAAARFVIRKVALVLDVKKSHDVFGEAIAFALALDVAVQLEALNGGTARHVGGAIHRATQAVGSAALEVITRAGREAFKASEGATQSSRFARVAGAIGRQVDETSAQLDRLMRHELAPGAGPDR